MTTQKEAHEIAAWMLEQYKKFGRLAQHRAAWHIRNLFGEKHLHKNKNGNWAINKPILDEFRKIRPADVVWSKSHQLWRNRTSYDPPTGIMVR